MSKFNIPLAQNCLPPPFAPDKPWLAPLAGYSDLPFRLLCSDYGACACETEMISAKGLCMASPGTAELLRNSPDEAPLVAQLFGHDPASMGQAAGSLRRAGWLWLDCNLGCPARKVMRQGAGCALLDEPETVMAIARAMLRAINEPDSDWLYPDMKGKIGFKLRLGREAPRSVLPDLALRLEDAGASWISLHPRYGKEGFSGTARWEEIAALARRLAIPLMASGDLLSARQGLACLAGTGAAGVMYARGALRDPAIFSRHQAGFRGEEYHADFPGQLLAIIRKHIYYARIYMPEPRAFNKIRSVLPRYARHLRGVGELRRSLCACSGWEELEDVLTRFMCAAREEN